MVPQRRILHCLTVYREEHSNLVSGIDNRRKKLSRGKDPNRHIPGRCIITITICNNDDAAQSHHKEMHSRIKTQLIARKDQPLDVHGSHQNAYQKQKRNGKPHADSENIQSRYRKGIWHRKMSNTNNERLQMTPKRRSKTTNSSNNNNARRKGNLQILGHVGSWHLQISGNERNI